MNCALRILHVASGDLWAGAEVQAFTLISRLREIPDTKVAAIVMNEGQFAEKLRSIGMSVYLLDERKSTSVRLFAGMIKVMRSWRPDIVHTHREKENILASVANRLCVNVPSVRTVHGSTEYPVEGGWRGLRQALVSELNRYCGRKLQQRIIAVSSELGRKLGDEYPPDKIVAIENGVDFDELIRQAGVDHFREMHPEDKHIGIAGRLVQVKRVDLFLRTAAALKSNNHGFLWKFHVFGDGPMRAKLETLSENLQLRGVVTFHGHRQDIARCLGGLDALVICSDHEGMPMVSLEAAALGTPTVAHAVGGLIEVVPEEFLVSQHDCVGYMNGILRAIAQDGRSIAEAKGRQIVMRLSAQRNATRIRELYEEMVREKIKNSSGYEGTRTLSRHGKS